MSKYIALGLRALALGGSVASATAAFPAASNTFGAAPGGFLLLATACIIYAGWHYAATTDSTDRRLVAGGMATVFAAAMTYGIYTSANIKASDNASQAASDADALYQQQEKTRLLTLTSITAELRATSKSKYPLEYTNLQQQIDKLSTPTPRQASASQIVQGAQASSLYQWCISTAFETITVVLLMMAGFFTRQPTDNPVTTLSTTPPTQEKQEVEPVAVNEPEPPTIPPTPPAKNPVNLLETRQIQPNNEGYITAAAIVDATSCTDRQARDAIKTGYQQGWLNRTGEGGATRYSYATQQPKLRRVK